MIAHQVAALHSLVMNAVARANDLTKLHKSFPGHQTYSIEANRNAATAGRLVTAMIDGYAVLDRVRRVAGKPSRSFNRSRSRLVAKRWLPAA